MSRYNRSIVATEQAVATGSHSNSPVILFLCQENFAVRDAEKRRVVADYIHFTHLSLDGAGGGIYNIPWEANKKFLEHFAFAQRQFLQSQLLHSRYSICPPPSISEIISNCEFIRPVFDLDLWDEGVFEPGSPAYAHLRKRITWQILCIHDVMKRLFPTHILDAPDFSADRHAWPMDQSLDWKKLDMVVLESPPKPMPKQVHGEQHEGAKHSFHIRFPFVRVPTRMMLGIIPYMIHELNKMCPRTLEPDGSPVRGLANSWYEGLDPKIIGSGIKLPGSQKAQPCNQCHALVAREREEERVAKAKRQLLNTAMMQALKRPSPLSIHSSEADDGDAAAPAEAEPVRSRKAHSSSLEETVETLRINQQFVKLPTKDEIQQRLDQISATTVASQFKFGPSRCGHAKCVNMKMYDGRFHRVVSLIDATAQFNRLALVDIVLLSNAAKMDSFCSDDVRMLSFLQARTPFKTSNVDFNPRINFQEYTNMYKDMAHQVSTTLSGTKRTRETTAQPSQAPTNVQPRTPEELYALVMSRSPISDEQQQTALKIARLYDPHYSSLECATMDWCDSCFILRPLKNDAGRYCLNKQTQHSYRTVFFVFYVNRDGRPIVYPNCFSNKDIAHPAHNQSCSDFYKSRRKQLARPIMMEDAVKLFRPYYEELAKMQSTFAARPAERDEVVDMILSKRQAHRGAKADEPSGPDASRGLGVSRVYEGRPLITSKELRDIERSARHTGSDVFVTTIPLIETAYTQGSLHGLVASYAPLLSERAATPVNLMPRPLSSLSVQQDEGDLESFLRSQHRQLDE